MPRTIITVATFILLVASPAMAQQSSDGLGKALGDTVSGALGSDSQQLQGHVVLASGPDLIFRSKDGRTYSVDMAALPAADWRKLQPGDSVKLAAKRGANADMLIARRIDVDRNTPRAEYRTANGTVQSVSESAATLRTNDGRLLALDLSSLPNSTRPALNQPATVIYERPRGSGRATALWVDKDTASYGTQPSASLPTEPQGGTAPSSQSGYQRIHGYVESVGISRLTLKADNGQTVAIDTSALDRQIVASMRPGDVVSVVGQMTGTSFRAAVLQKE